MAESNEEKTALAHFIEATGAAEVLIRTKTAKVQEFEKDREAAQKQASAVAEMVRKCASKPDDVPVNVVLEKIATHEGTMEVLAELAEINVALRRKLANAKGINLGQPTDGPSNTKSGSDGGSEGPVDNRPFRPGDMALMKRLGVQIPG